MIFLWYNAALASGELFIVSGETVMCSNPALPHDGGYGNGMPYHRGKHGFGKKKCCTDDDARELFSLILSLQFGSKPLSFVECLTHNKSHMHTYVDFPCLCAFELHILIFL